VLGREAVLHGHGERAGPRGEAVHEGVLGGVGRGPRHEPAAVEVEHDGEPPAVAVAGARGGVREVEARPQARGRVDGDVPGGDAGGGVHGGRDRGDGEQALHAAALVLPDHGHELERDLGVGIHVERDDAVAKFRRDGYRVCARQIDAPWR